MGGAIGLPFSDADADAAGKEKKGEEEEEEGREVGQGGEGVAVVYGLVGKGVGTAGGPRAPPPPLAAVDAPRPVVVTGDDRGAILKGAKEVALGEGGAGGAGGGTAVQTGATGNKLLAVAEGRCDVAVLHFKTSLWDTCATEAVLNPGAQRRSNPPQ